MAIIILSHKVKDFNSWKPIYDADKPRRDAASLKELGVGRKSDDPNNVYVIMETDDPANIDKLLSDPGLKDKMNEAGVVSAPEIVVLN